MLSQKKQQRTLKGYLHHQNYLQMHGRRFRLLKMLKHTSTLFELKTVLLL